MLPLQRPENVPGVKNLFKLENLYIASQPTDDSFSWIKEQNIQKVINLRDFDEMDFEFEKSLCREANIEYHQFPITKEGKFITENIKKLNELIADKNNNYFVHCGTANRVIAWLLIYLPTHKDMSFDETKKLAMQMGFTNEKFVLEAQDFLGKNTSQVH